MELFFHQTYAYNHHNIEKPCFACNNNSNWSLYYNMQMTRCYKHCPTNKTILAIFLIESAIRVYYDRPLLKNLKILTTNSDCDGCMPFP